MTNINDGVGKTLVMDVVREGLRQVVCHKNHHYAMMIVANYYRVFQSVCCLHVPSLFG
jgi:hypothetical protein